MPPHQLKSRRLRVGRTIMVDVRTAQCATLLQMSKHYFTGDFRMVPATYAARRWAKAVLEAWSGAPALYLSVFREQASWFALMVAEELRATPAAPSGEGEAP